MPDLLLAMAGLLLGPVAYRLCQRREEIYGFLDGFVLVGVAGLILTEVIPETLHQAGPAAIGLAALGFALPFLLERRLALLPFSPNFFFRWLMVLGLVLHQTLDGVALSKGIDQTSLRLAVVLHQVPKGFFIWGMAGAAMGRALGVAMIGGLCLATVGGFLVGDGLLTAVAGRPLWLFQAFIGGGLLHVIVHHVPWRAPVHCEPGCPAGEGPTASRKIIAWSGVGALVSFLALIAMSHFPASAGAEGDAEPARVGTAFTSLAVESAPSILLGFIAAGIFSAFLPRVLSSWLGGRGRMSQALRGIAIGVPLPICSCGVAPVYLSLLKKSVPPAAALAFLIATPEIGIDSIFLSGKLLGLKITLIRLTMAFLIALFVALALARTFEKIREKGDLEHLTLPPERPIPPTFRGKLREAARFGGREIVDHTGAWLLVGLMVAAMLEPYLDPGWLRNIPAGLDVLALSLLGLPLYVCASGATPLAAVLLHKGLSTGAVLAFLITGPSTNVTTFGILKRYHGIRGAALFAGAIYVFSVAIGFAINWIFPDTSAPIGQVLEHPDHGPLAWASAVVLLALFAGSLLRLGPRGFLATLSETLGGLPTPPHTHDHHHHHHHGSPPAAGPARAGLPLALLAVALLGGAAVRAGEPPADTAGRRILLELNRAARENAERPERPQGAALSTPPRPPRLKGDALADHLVREAARAARKELDRGAPPRDCARGFLFALGLGLDPSGALKKFPLSSPFLGRLETDQEAASRISATGGATLRGRLDLLQHFSVAAALTALAGEAPAWVASLEKETRDARQKDGGKGTGFCFADLDADRGGIELAVRLLDRGPEDLARILDRLARDFRGSDFVPDPARYRTDPLECLGWKDFQARFGSLTDSRFTDRVRALREEVLRLPGFAALR